MSSDEPAFMAAILTEPAEDTHRLVYADWLQEYGGRPERAEFIRVQVELARMKPPRKINPLGMTNLTDAAGRCARAILPRGISVDAGEVIDVEGGSRYSVDGALVKAVRMPEPGGQSLWVEAEYSYDGVDHYPHRARLHELRDRERELLLNHPAVRYWGLPDSLNETHPHRDIAAVLPAVRCFGHGVREMKFLFRRGFVEEVACEAGDWFRHADAIRAALPITRVKLTTTVIPGRVHREGGTRYTLDAVGGPQRVLAIDYPGRWTDRFPRLDELLAAEWPGIAFEREDVDPNIGIASAVHATDAD